MIDVVEQVLADRSGLDVSVFGRDAIERAVAARMSAGAAPDRAAYLRLICSSAGELDNLVQELTITETWFFRDRGPFEFLGSFARDLPYVRVLSAPCATGEEAFSIVITLLDAGLPPERFHVDACDLNQWAIQTALRAIYGSASFRENWRDHRTRWFEPVEDGFKLRSGIAGLVQFHKDDLLHPVFLASQPAYDVVFCRNLLIYLRTEAQHAIIDRIGTLLKRDAVVVTGHSEVNLFLRHGYEAASSPRAFACRRAAPAQVQRSARAPAPRALRVTRPHPVTPALERQAAADRRVLLECALQMADGGALDDAWSLCEELLAQEPDADAYCLKGLICAARDRLAAAEECFRRALFLEPAHYETLVHLSWLCERQGDRTRAALFRTRAASVETRNREAADGRGA